MFSLRQGRDRLRLWIARLHLEIDWLPILWSGITLTFCLAVLIPAYQSYEYYYDHAAQPNQNGGENYPWWQYSGAWVAVFTIVLTASTVALWISNERTLSHARKSSERQLRAYLTLDLAGIVWASPAPDQVTIWMRFKNTGVTPAYRARGWMLISDGAAGKETFAKQGEFANETVVGPGGTVNLSDTRHCDGTKFLAIKAATHSFFVWGRAEYEDAFGEPRFFNFKGEMNGPLQTIIIDGARAQGWGFDAIQNGVEAN